MLSIGPRYSGLARCWSTRQDLRVTSDDADGADDVGDHGDASAASTSEQRGSQGTGEDLHRLVSGLERLVEPGAAVHAS